MGSVFAGCSAGKSDKGNKNATAGVTGSITVVSREEGSGTRGAFIELLGIEEKDANGNKIDKTTTAAEITNSTAVMLTTVAGNKNAIGYVSLGSLNDTVQALTIDGTEPTAENVKNGSYKISRPFNIVTKDDLSPAAKDFINYIQSADGQKIIEDNHYVSRSNTGAFKSSGFLLCYPGNGKIGGGVPKDQRRHYDRGTAKRLHHRDHRRCRRHL